MRFGAMQGILRCGTQDAIEQAAAVGFDGLEIVAAAHEDPEEPFWSPDGRKALSEAAAEHRIALPSVCLGYLNRQGLTADAPAARDAVRGNIEHALAAAVELGIAVMLIPFFGKAEITEQVHKERVIEGLRRLAGTAERAGVTLALENTLSAGENRQIIEAVASPAIKVYYDVSNATWWGHDPVTEIQSLGGLIAQVHFKDGAGGHSNAQLGEGHVDWMGVREALRSIGYDGWIVLESAVEGDPIGDARENLAFAKGLMDNVRFSWGADPTSRRIRA